MTDSNKRTTHWINQLLTEISQLDDITGKDILNSCGKSCCENSDLYQGAVRLRNKSLPEKNIDELFNEFTGSYYSSGNITKEGNVITLIFEECTCPMVRNGVSNSFLCHCTTGYSQRLFEVLFDRKVRVDLEQSILRGDSICKQTITIIE